LSSLPATASFPCGDVTPVTSTPRSSVARRSTSLTNVIVPETDRHKRTVDQPPTLCSGSLRHKDSILLRKSKLRELQLGPSPRRRLSGGGDEAARTSNVTVQVVDNPDGDNSVDDDDYEDSPELSTRPVVSRNWGTSEVGQSHAGVTAAPPRDDWLPEFGSRNSGEKPSSSQLLGRCRCKESYEASFDRSHPAANSLTVILSAVDLPYTPRSTIHCRCQATLDIRCLPVNAGWRCRAVTTVVQPQSRTGGRLRRKLPDGTRSGNCEVNGKNVHADAAGTTATGSSPEPFPRRGDSSPSCDDCPAVLGDGDQLTMTSQRRVLVLARAYSDRVKQLQRRMTTTHVAGDFDVAAAVERRVPRSRSASVGRRTVSPEILYV